MSFASALRRIVGTGSGRTNDAGGDAPTKAFVVTISHSLGRAEAIRRIKGGLGQVSGLLAEKKIGLAENAWNDNKGEFTVRALGQTVTALVEVFDELVKIEARLPWMLAGFAEQAKGAIQSNGRLLLAKK